ncbi:hypothetical protein EFL79_10405 [Weissella confusa]|nr:hypothetical protein [Weissella confusa]
MKNKQTMKQLLTVAHTLVQYMNDGDSGSLPGVRYNGSAVSILKIDEHRSILSYRKRHSFQNEMTLLQFDTKTGGLY